MTNLKIIIDVKNLTTDQHKTLKTYSNSAMDHIKIVQNTEDHKPIQSVGFNLKRIEQALEYIINVVNKIEPND